MRTTLDLNDELMRQVKHHAADQGLTLREIFEQALRAHLDRRPRRRKPYRLQWRGEGGGLQPGVSPADFEHSARLRDLMDGIE
ncbi:MAG TPA: ribbon-helix-helix domain-containing protein [Myxococcales bacterium]|nr:ribbon-helix-helix domain-containing protein [Myxococcales bacterium]